MSNKNEVAIIINAYERAKTDSDELFSYLDKINSIDDISDTSLPAVVLELQTQEAKRTQEYLACASITGGSVATAVGTALAGGALIKSASSATIFSLATTYGSYVAVGLGMPILAGFALPIIAVPTVMKLINDGKIKKYRKAKDVEFKEKKKKFSMYRDKLQNFIDEVQRRLKDIDVFLKEELSRRARDYQEKAKKLAVDVSIQIDDIVNAGANERILKYNEIILNQYGLQKTLEENLDFLYKEFDKLLKEKEELEKKMCILMQLLNTMGCPESVISMALDE